MIDSRLRPVSLMQYFSCESQVFAIVATETRVHGAYESCSINDFVFCGVWPITARRVMHMTYDAVRRCCGSDTPHARSLC
jgi:hypothetical protein